MAFLGVDNEFLRPGITSPFGPAAAAGPAGPAAPAAPAASKPKGAIPNAGIYLEQQALAQQAYEAAISQLNQQQSSLYNRFGLRMNNDQMEVDPHNQFGEYQQLRRGQAIELEDIEDNTRARGLMGGLAGQMLNPARYAHGLQNLGLSNSFLDAFRGIQTGRQSALFQKNRAMWEAERDAAMRAIDEEDFTPADPTPERQASPSQPQPSPTAGTAAARQRLASAYNPAAYVRGGAPVNVARATQNKGYSSMYNPLAYVRGGAPVNVARATQLKGRRR